MKGSLVVVMTAFLFVPSAFARPISYADSWTVMQRNNQERSLLHLHYSPGVQDSYGLLLENFNQGQRKNVSLQWNHLQLRRNTRYSQFNLYSKTIFGLAFDDERTEPNVDLRLSADWETRRYFLASELGFEYADEFDDGSFHQMGRVGIAPYVAESGSIHTWLMLQVENHPERKDKDEQFILTPLIRVFKGDLLFELGVDSNADVLFNWIYRF